MSQHSPNKIKENQTRVYNILSEYIFVNKKKILWKYRGLVGWLFFFWMKEFFFV